MKITSYSGPGGNKSVSTGRVGNVRSPKGDIVRETSAYGRVKFDIKNIIDVGVDYVSSGALTHSAPIMDISLKNLHAI